MKKCLLALGTCLSLALTGCAGLDFQVVKENNQALAEQKSKSYTYNPEHYPVTITNLNTKGEPEEQIIKKPPQRIVAMWQNSIETPLALGLGDRIVVGVGVPDKKYFRKEYQEAYSKIPMSGFRPLDVETTLMQEPDIIIGWQSTFSPKVLRPTDFWHKRGVATFIADGASTYHKEKTLAGEWNDILTLGKIFDRNERAQEIVEQMRQEINFVTEKTKGIKRKSRALIIEYMGRSVRVYGERTLAGDITRQLNGELLAAKETTIGIEQIVDMDPDVIFVIVCERDYGSEERILGRLLDNPALAHIRCVQEKRVHPLHLGTVYAAGVRAYEGIQIIAKGMYPELYGKGE